MDGHDRRLVRVAVCMYRSNHVNDDERRFAYCIQSLC